MNDNNNERNERQRRNSNSGSGINGGRGSRPENQNRNYESEGVYYTPSQKPERGQGQRSTQRPTQRPAPDQVIYPHERPVRKGAGGGSRKRGKASQKSQLSVYYIVALLVSVSVCVAAVAILINSFGTGGGGGGGTADAEQPNLPPVITQTDEEEDNAVLTNVIAVITSAAGSGIEIVDVYTEESHIVTVAANTRLSDRFDRPLVVEEFTPGSIVDVSFDENTNIIRTMRMNATAWERRLVINVRIDTGAGTLTIGNDIFTLSDNVVVRSRGQTLDISRISGIDLLNVRGYRDKAWHIELVSGSGIIEVTNRAAIRNGTIEIGTNILYALEDANEIAVLAGYHNVVVRGDNIELFVEEIEVVEGERQVLDLSRVRMLNGVLEITSNVTGFRAYIDGREVSLLAPIPLEFGEYSLRVTRDGYEPHESQITINTEVVRVHAELTRIVNLGDLVIETVPAGASVFINDILRGDSPTTISLEHGTYMLRITLPEHEDIVVPVEIFDRDHRFRFYMHRVEDIWVDDFFGHSDIMEEN